MSFLNAFFPSSQRGDSWFFAGSSTSYPNITASGSAILSDHFPCNDNNTPGCKVFRVPLINSAQAAEVDLTEIVPAELSEQVLVFQFQSEFHAVDHVSYTSVNICRS